MSNLSSQIKDGEFQFLNLRSGLEFFESSEIIDTVHTCNVFKITKNQTLSMSILP